MVYTYKAVALIEEGYKRLNPCCNGWCTHTQKLQFFDTNTGTVLILVVMDGVHIQNNIFVNILLTGLNPCCNGWCTHTTQCKYKVINKSLNPCCNGWCTHTQEKRINVFNKES